MIIILLAGGAGQRLFPFSSKTVPKPFLKFSEKGSLLKITLLRFINKESVKKILICTDKFSEPLAKKEIQNLKNREKCQIVAEPERKNTLAAVVFSLSHLNDTESAEPIFVIPSDHFIHPEEVFFSHLEEVSKSMPKDRLVALGVFPQSPETGYGYIKKGIKDNSFYNVEEFVEKPSISKAKEYLFSKEYLWNMGILGFYKEFFLKEVRKYQPLYCQVNEDIEAFYKTLPSLSLDHGLLQKTHSLLVSEIQITWSDIGSWDRVYETLDKDEDGNIFLGEVHSIATKKSLVMGKDKPIYTIGLEDIWVIDTEKALLIGKKGFSEEVKGLDEL